MTNERRLNDSHSKTDTCNHNNAAKFVTMVVAATVVDMILARRCPASLYRRSVTDTLLCVCRTLAMLAVATHNQQMSQPLYTILQPKCVDRMTSS